MKIKELHLRNIASIEKADIDFEKDVKDQITGDPASIFLISGDTGSGKSVILDGISMALYKKTPRIESVANKKENNYADNEGQSISINSIVQYTRLGISNNDDCYSEVVFEGNDGIEYRAKLELGITKSNKEKEANGNPLLKYSAPKWKFKVGDEDWKNVERNTGQPILGAVGLTFEQFGRMAMLAQGQFASFLTGDKTERESILEQLTNTEKFTDYGEAISRLYKKAKNNQDNAQVERDTEKEHTLEPEKLKELNDTLEGLKEDKKNLDKEKSQAGKTLVMVREISEKRKEKQTAESQKSDIETTINGEEYKGKKALVEDWDATNSERQTLSNKLKASEEKEEEEKKLQQAKVKFAVLCADIAFREEVIGRKTDEIAEIEKWVNDRKNLEDVYTQADALSVKLGNYKKVWNRLSVAEDNLATEQGKTERLEKEAGDCKKKDAAAKDSVKEKQDAIDAKMKERNALNPSEVAGQIKDANKRKSDLEQLQKDSDILEKKRTSAQTDKKGIDKDEIALAERKAEYDAAQSDYEKKAEEEARTRSLLSTMKMSVQETLTELRKRLQKDNADTCPLCGQHIDHLHLDDDFKGILSPLEEQEKDAKENLRKATTNRDNAKTDYDTLKGALGTRRKAYDKEIDNIKEEENAIAENAKALGLDPSRPLGPQIEDELTNVGADIAQLEKKQTKADDLQKEIDILTKEKTPLDQDATEAAKQYIKAKNALEQNGREIERLTKEAKDLKQEKSGLKKELDTSLAASFPTWVADIDATTKKLKGDADEYLMKKNSAENGKADIEKDNASLETIVGIRNDIAMHTAWKVDVDSKCYPTVNINAEWTALHSDIYFHEHKIVQAKAVIDQSNSSLDEFYRKTGKTEEILLSIIKSGSRVADARMYVDKQNAQLKSVCDSIGACQQRIDNLMKALNVEKHEDMPGIAQLEERIKELETKLDENARNTGAISSQLKQDADNTKRLENAEDQLAKATEVFNKWDRLYKVFGGTRFRTLVQTYILRPLLNNANIYLEKITDRYKLTCSEDNEHLSILVLDRYNKNQVRSVTVLSGGERFMISLALSLALSSLNRQDMNVNILFIDEGFGTLDETNLNSVMSTLEKLQEIAGQTNRRVGIISHREELVERIPVKIQVRKKGEGRSHVVVTNE